MNKRKILVIGCHADDEILISALLSRLNSDDSVKQYFALFSNGDSNTSNDRFEELKNSLGCLGINEQNTPISGPFHSENTIRNAVFFEKDVEKAVDKVNLSYGYILDYMKGVYPDTVFVTAFQGGNFTHDLLNMIAFKAAGELRNRRKDIALIEYAQFQMTPGVENFDISRLVVNSILTNGTKEAPYNNKDLGIEDGVLVLDREEYDMKFNRIPYCYESQLGQLEFFRKSIPQSHEGLEIFQRIPDDRDYTQRPHDGILFWEGHMNQKYRLGKEINFQHFANIAAEFLKQKH